jgi:hypothetical protein
LLGLGLEQQPHFVGLQQQAEQHFHFTEQHKEVKQPQILLGVAVVVVMVVVVVVGIHPLNNQ